MRRHTNPKLKHYETFGHNIVDVNFKTGDYVVANVIEGRKAGIYQGTVSCRRTGSFDIRSSSGRIQGINHKWFRRLQHADGYSYFTERKDAVSSPCLKPGASAAQQFGDELIEQAETEDEKIFVQVFTDCILQEKQRKIIAEKGFESCE